MADQRFVNFHWPSRTCSNFNHLRVPRTSGHSNYEIERHWKSWRDNRWYRSEWERFERDPITQKLPFVCRTDWRCYATSRECGRLCDIRNSLIEDHHDLREERPYRWGMRRTFQTGRPVTVGR
jgi:hypothetical protein